MKIKFKKIFELTWIDIKEVLNDSLGLIVNSLLLPITFVAVNAYVLPALGTSSAYVNFLIIGLLILTTHNTQLGFANDLLFDIKSKAITLHNIPLPPEWFFMKHCVVYTLKSIIANFAILPLVILMVPSFDSSCLSISRPILFFIIMNFFVACTCALSAVVFKSNQKMWQIWPRWGQQLFNLSGLRASWLTMHNTLPGWSVLNLLNPYLYVFEGMRGAISPQGNYINFWACCIVTIFSSIVCALIGMELFKRRIS